MPIFYNTGAPTPSTKNTINEITVTYGIRDFLLNKNLLPVYPQISTSLNGSPRIGEPVLDTSINGNANVIPFGLPLETEGLTRYNDAIAPNQFKNTDSNAPSLINIDDVLQIQGIFGNIDFPQGTQSYPTSSSQDVATYGLLGKTNYAELRKKATLRNLYLDVDKQIDMADFISLQPAGFSSQMTSYIDEYGHLNLGDGSAVNTANIIGSVLNGQGLGFTKGGVVTNYDIRSSLAGRVLGASGTINDTNLGKIGGQQLALALANNAAFNLQEDILGGLNVQDNVLSIVKNGTLAGFRPNYQITVASSGLGKVADYTSRILGFTLPKSYLSDAGSIFLNESNSGNVERANSMILNTGKGQVDALINNVNANILGTTQYDNPDSTPFRSGYVPGYKNNKGEKAINPKLYAFYNSDNATILDFILHSSNVIPEISYNRSAMISKYGFKTPEETFTGPRGNSGYDNRKLSDIGFTWTSRKGENVNGTTEYDELPLTEKKSILTKTQKLFNSVGMKTIVTSKGDMDKTSSQIETANGGGFSKGSAVIGEDRYTADGIFDGKKDTAANTYCRSWTTLDRYDTVSKLIRHKGLDETYPYRNQMTNSVLDDNGFVKIGPYKTDSSVNPNTNSAIVDPKNYMFSIENLAWFDNVTNLISAEQGPGDLLSGKRGRIMWFPPYNIQFSESSSVNWDTNNFIGRGEPVYTYNNTERSGNLSFQVVVDHPSYVNSFAGTKGPDDNYVASFFAGCVKPNQKFVDKLTVSEISSLVSENATIPQKKVPIPEPEPESFTVYYPNDEKDFNKVYLTGYENGLMNGSPIPNTQIDYSDYPSGLGYGIGTYSGGTTSSTQWNDRTNYGLNSNVILDGDTYANPASDTYLNALNTFLINKCPNCIVNIKSYASPQGNATANDKLANGRTDSIYDKLFQTLYQGKTNDYKKKRFNKLPNEVLSESSTGCVAKATSDTDTKACKEARKSVVTFKFNYNLAEDSLPQPRDLTATTVKTVSNKITNRLYNESNYFEKLTELDPFVFDRFREKIRYFHPAFHSTTPEGLNSRLTFLQQCTRQGPTLESQDANNLAFGRPPVCILRIGDFYNTKIVIDNLSIDYEPLVWDLNPEGIGVQPMIANVTLSFKFVGGSTLMGPINKLQNALSFNYYANTQVYDPRADYISKERTVTRIKDKAGKESTKTAPISDTNNYVNNLMNDNYFGDNNLFNKSDKINSQTLVNNTPAQNQVAGNNVATAQQTTTPPPSSGYTNDVDRIVFVRVDSITNGIQVTFQKEGDGDLTKELDFRLFVTDNVSAKVEIGVGKINKTADIQQFQFTNLATTLVDGKAYFASAKIGSEIITNKFTYTVK